MSMSKSIGSVVALPTGSSNFAHVRDEYGNNYSVHASSLPDDADEGDSFAYRVAITGGSSYTATTITAVGD